MWTFSTPIPIRTSRSSLLVFPNSSQSPFDFDAELIPGAPRRSPLRALFAPLLQPLPCLRCFPRGEAMLGPFGFRLLPWDYGVRNLLRRPARTAMTLFGLTVVVLLVLVVVGFIRGLESSLKV